MSSISAWGAGYWGRHVNHGKGLLWCCDSERWLGTTRSAFLLRQQPVVNILWRLSNGSQRRKVGSFGGGRAMWWPAGAGGCSGRGRKQDRELRWVSLDICLARVQVRPMEMPLPAAALECQWEWTLILQSLWRSEVSLSLNAVSGEGTQWREPLCAHLPGWICSGSIEQGKKTLREGINDFFLSTY